jgi:hypothetical protein
MPKQQFLSSGNYLKGPIASDIIKYNGGGGWTYTGSAPTPTYLRFNAANLEAQLTDVPFEALLEIYVEIWTSAGQMTATFDVPEWGVTNAGAITSLATAHPARGTTLYVRPPAALPFGFVDSDLTAFRVGCTIKPLVSVNTANAANFKARLLWVPVTMKPLWQDVGI